LVRTLGGEEEKEKKKNVNKKEKAISPLTYFWRGGERKKEGGMETARYSDRHAFQRLEEKKEEGGTVGSCLFHQSQKKGGEKGIAIRSKFRNWGYEREKESAAHL